MKQFHGYIYLIRDQLHNKVYIGQKTVSPEKSKDYYGSGKIIKSIIKERSTYFLKKIILGEIFCDNVKDFKKQLDDAETECIYFFRSYGSDGKKRDEIYGYNLTKKGNSQTGYKWTQEQCSHKYTWKGLKQTSIHIQKRVDKIKGVSKTEEHKENLSISLTGKIHSLEFCKKISDATKGKNNPRYIEVDMNLIFELKEKGFSTYRIAKIMNINRTVVKNRLEDREKYS